MTTQSKPTANFFSQLAEVKNDIMVKAREDEKAGALAAATTVSTVFFVEGGMCAIKGIFQEVSQGADSAKLTTQAKHKLNNNFTLTVEEKTALKNQDDHCTMTLAGASAMLITGLAAACFYSGLKKQLNKLGL